MPHARGKQLDGIHDLLHMLQKIFIANYNYQPVEATVAATALISLIALATYGVRKKNSSLEYSPERAEGKICYIFGHSICNNRRRTRPKYISLQELSHS